MIPSWEKGNAYMFFLFQFFLFFILMRTSVAVSLHPLSSIACLKALFMIKYFSNMKCVVFWVFSLFLNSEEGQVRKVLKAEPLPDGSGYFFNLSMFLLLVLALNRPNQLTCNQILPDSGLKRTWPCGQVGFW